MTNFPRFDQFGQRAHRLLNRSIRIDAMLIIEINVIDAQPPQTSVARFLHIIRLAIDTANIGVRRIADNPKLRGQHNLIAFALDRASDELFILVRSIDIGGVEKVDAQFERPMNSRNRLGVIASRVKLRHTHAAQTDGGNFEAGTSKIARFHSGFPFIRKGTEYWKKNGRSSPTATQL